MTPEKRRMARWAPWALLVVVLVAAFVIGSGSRGHRSLDERTRDVAATLKCPECTDKSMAASDAPTSIAGRAEIRRQLAEGRSPSEIRQWFESRYDSSILLTPQRSGIQGLIWIVPVVGFVIAVAALVALFRRWHREGGGVLTAEDQEIVALAREQPVEEP